MADNYTLASFIIPCTQEQAKMAQEAITFVTEAEIAEGERLIDKPLADCSLTEKLILSIIENHPEYDLQSRALGNHPAQTVIMNCRSQQKLTAVGCQFFMERLLILTMQFASQLPCCRYSTSRKW
uniref:Uncharacterized protein n=1 Tax=Salmonella enteritidis TaxID=149539 RepID=A0A1S6KR12_SALEN|nr:hypothetical protein [Salmonella enterica]AQT23783.1 hypothetical protein [Salmonella enterica subsp. enterica serovar Enteritidis]